MLAGPQLLTGFSLADIADRHWGKLTDVLKRLKRAGLDAIAEAPVDRLHDAEDALRECEAAGLPVRCLSLQSPISSDGRSSWLIHLRDLVRKFPAIDTVNPLSRELLKGEFPEGSMGPKVRAAIEFVERGGQEVIITTPTRLEDAVAGQTGTRIVRE